MFSKLFHDTPAEGSTATNPSTIDTTPSVHPAIASSALATVQSVESTTPDSDKKIRTFKSNFTIL